MTAPQFLQWIVSVSVQAAVVVAVASAADRWMKLSSARQARVWTACFLCLLGMMAAGLLLPHVQWGNPWRSLSADAVVVTLAVEQVVSRLVLAVWLAGASVQAARSAWRQVGMQRFIASCPPATVEARRKILEVVGSSASSLGGRGVEFRDGPEELGPFCYQLHRPIVFLPPSLLRGDRQQLQLALDHELTHLRTEHPMQVFLENVVACVLWFHPSVWAASRRASLVREFVCDDAAAGGGASTVAYLRLLLRVAESTSRATRPALALRRSVSEVRARVARLVAQRGRTVRAPAAGGVFAVVLASFVGALLWVPLDPLTSPRATLSPWPTWSASVLHTLDLPVRDFQPYDERARVHEIVEGAGRGG